MTQRDRRDRIMLLSVRMKPAGHEDWMDVARNAPSAFHREGEFIDLGPILREVFGGGLSVQLGAEVEVAVRWVSPPPEWDE